MRQRIVIGEASQMLGPTTPGDTTLIYPYVRSVRTEEDRESPISTMTVVLPPYPAEKISRIRVGMTIRWEAGYWEDGIRPLNKRGEGYHEEFEGVITSVARELLRRERRRCHDAARQTEKPSLHRHRGDGLHVSV